MKYKEGQTVHVKMGGLIVPGKIKHMASEGSYTILFEGGSEKLVAERMIKPADGKIMNNEDSPPKIDIRSPSRRAALRQSPSRSTSKRTPSPVRKRSPGRNKTRASPSPGRSRLGASPSPGRSRLRSSPSPGRKSPSRAKRSSPSPSRIKTIPQLTTPTRILKVSLENIDVSGDYLPRQRKVFEHEITHEIRTLESVSHDILDPKPLDVEPYEKPDLQNTNQFLNLNDIGKFSDDDDIVTEVKFPIRERKSESRSIKPPREFGGWFGTFLLTFLIPASVLLLHVLCNKDYSCTFSKLKNFQEIKVTEIYFDMQVTAIYVSYIILLAVLSKLPYIGRKVKSLPSKEQSYTYKMNGLFSAFFLLILIITLESQNYPVVNYLIDKYFHFLVSSLMVGLFISLVLYFKSKFAPISLLNPYASTYNFIYDFFLGRQVNPRIFSIDVKIVLLRASYIAALIINSAFIFKSMNVSLNNDNFLNSVDIEMDPALIICGGLHIFYILDFLLFEKNLVTTFELQYEGLGYMRVMLYSAYPFFTTATTKYLYDHNNVSERNVWVLGAIVFVFFVGYCVYRGSNSQKNAFRINPYDGALSHLQSMPTGQGKKLLTSGWWGRLRHPNYAGDILMHLAMGALCAGSVAGLGILPPALFLAVRASRDSKRCRRRYGPAWDRYTYKVRYNILPFVY